MTHSPASLDTPTSSGVTRHPVRIPWPWFLAADLVLVIVFAAIGRASHSEDAVSALVTAWPFLLGAGLGWLLVRAWRRPAALWPTGIVIWWSTEIIGMALRTVTGQGTAWSFVLVSLAVLGVFLVGYRLIVHLVHKSRNRR